jgi:hypothetical protein
MHACTAAMRAFDFGPISVGDVVLMREFLVAVFAVINVLRHNRYSGEQDSSVCPVDADVCARELAVVMAECQLDRWLLALYSGCMPGSQSSS